MVALRLAPVCVLPHDVSWSPILTVPEGATFATHTGKRLLVIVAPKTSSTLSPFDFGHHHAALKQALHHLLGGQQTIQAWMDMVSSEHSDLEIAGMLIEHTHVTFFASNGAGVVMMRHNQAGLLCASVPGQIIVSEGTLLPQDRFMLGNATLLATLQPSSWSFMVQYSFDQTRKHIEHAMQAKTDHWFVGALGEAIASHTALEPGGNITSGHPTWPTRLRQRLSPHYPRLKGPKHRISRMSLSVGVLLLILLLVSIYLGGRQRQERHKTEQFNAFVEPLETQVAQAYALQEANPLEAKRLVNISLETFVQGKSTYELEPQFKARLEALEKTLTQATMEVIGISQATSLSPWHDLSLIKNGALGTEIAVAGDQLFVLDQVGGFIYGIDVNSKEAQVVAGSPELRGSTHLAAMSNRLVVVSQGKLLEISASQKTTAFLTTDSEASTSIKATAFWLGNIYTLDPGVPTIWKYPASGQGVGQAQSWLKDSSLLDTNAIDMAIDGDVWVLHGTGTLMRLRQGLRAGFALETNNTPLTSAAGLAIGQENDVLFVYDSVNDRILEITKAGIFKREYTLDEQLVVQDMAYCDTTDQLFLLSGNELFVVPR